MELTESRILNTLYREFGYRRELCVPHAPNGWLFENECDFLAITRAGRTECYEVKLSVGDYRRDFGKEWHHLLKQSYLDERKEASKQRRIPNRFFFAAPKGMLRVDAIPAYAGLVEIDTYPDRGPGWGYRVLVTKPAPTLHQQSLSERQWRQATRSIGYRYWSVSQSFENFADRVEYERKQKEEHGNEDD